MRFCITLQSAPVSNNARASVPGKLTSHMMRLETELLTLAILTAEALVGGS
jgi:hypothetical protein